jgi:hypothetical protein
LLRQSVHDLFLFPVELREPQYLTYQKYQQIT